MLENIVAIDVILFPGSRPSTCLSETNLNQYKKIKNAMLLNLYEVYKMAEHISENTYKGGVPEINKHSYQLGLDVFVETQNVLKNAEVLTEINYEVDSILSENTKMDRREVAKKVVIKTFLETALDMLMLETALSNADQKLFKSQHGEILLNAHRSFRNDLITLALG
jgi:hypothetical protein